MDNLLLFLNLPRALWQVFALAFVVLLARPAWKAVDRWKAPSRTLEPVNIDAYRNYRLERKRGARLDARPARRWFVGRRQ